MKSLSIKYFIVLSISFLLVGISLTFYNFYSSTKVNIAKLVKNDIQNKSIDIKHFLDKNLNNHNINELTSYLDSVASSSEMISDIHIVNNHNKTIYSSDRGYQNHKDIKCIDISKISVHNVFNHQCYSLSIKLYNNLEPYFYKALIYIDCKYLDNILYKNALHILGYLILLMSVFFILLWIALRKSIIRPLEELRQFAYYNDKVPNEFYINEIESIRYSLSNTFKRLKKEQEELYNISTRDQLSGLYNRMSLVEKIQWLISTNDRKNEKFAVIFIDLDNFKTINDSMGHEFGDKVLQKVSEILLTSVRENDIVSRLGGDEFVIVLTNNIIDENNIIDVLKRIQKHLSIPVSFEEYDKYYLTASMGISIFPRDGHDVNTLLKNADIAMYKSKELGKNNYHFFTDNLDHIIQEKVEIQNIMVDALQHGYFKLYYQPKVDIKQHKITECEALIRLIDPQKGLIPPDKFIHIAEDNNFILEIGEWVIQESVRQIKAWRDTKYKDIKISINISAMQFKDKNFVDKLDKYTKDIPRKLLDLELTESVLVNDFDEKYHMIQRIKELGFTLSLDDFGTGYSSLSYLKTIPFNTIKIDKSFIDGLEDKKDKNFVIMIINIAKTLNLEIVAEGVETKSQLKILQDMECDIYQGYLCSKPVEVEQFEELINSQC